MCVFMYRVFLFVIIEFTASSLEFIMLSYSSIYVLSLLALNGLSVLICQCH